MKLNDLVVAFNNTIIVLLYHPELTFFANLREGEVVVKLNIKDNQAILFIIGIYIQVLQCRISIVATGL
jgi:hypothetical protein